MKAHEEKRNYKRYNHHCPINLYHMDHQDQSFYAEMKNYSQGGTFLLTNEKLVVGQLVYLEIPHHDKQAQGPEKYKSYSGCVKWSNINSSSPPGTEKHKPCEYGIEYFKPVRYQ